MAPLDSQRSAKFGVCLIEFRWIPRSFKLHRVGKQSKFGVDVLGVCENEMKKITVGVFDYVLGVCENHGMVVVVFKKNGREI